MKKVICIWKPVGFTPLQAIFKFKDKNSEYKKEMISYAGRLDPMAEGILILLVGDENKNRVKYLELNKEYESELIFGVSTDTFDSLGLIKDVKFKELSNEEIKQALIKFKGIQKQIYPPYSSKSVNGKPLYWWSREKKLEKIKIPEREIEIYAIEVMDFEKENISKLVDNNIRKVKIIDGEFRQQEIIKKWEEFGKEHKSQDLIKVKVKIKCTSGTYIRRLADDIGKENGGAAFAFSIKRTKVGNYSLKDCMEIAS